MKILNVRTAKHNPYTNIYCITCSFKLKSSDVKFKDKIQPKRCVYKNGTLLLDFDFIKNSFKSKKEDNLKTCSECGDKISENDKFCIYCGFMLKTS